MLLRNVLRGSDTACAHRSPQARRRTLHIDRLDLAPNICSAGQVPAVGFSWRSNAGEATPPLLLGVVPGRWLAPACRTLLELPSTDGNPMTYKNEGLAPGKFVFELAEESDGDRDLTGELAIALPRAGKKAPAALLLCPEATESIDWLGPPMLPRHFRVVPQGVLPGADKHQLKAAKAAEKAAAAAPSSVLVWLEHAELPAAAASPPAIPELCAALCACDGLRRLQRCAAQLSMAVGMEFLLADWLRLVGAIATFSGRPYAPPEMDMPLEDARKQLSTLLLRADTFKMQVAANTPEGEEPKAGDQATLSRIAADQGQLEKHIAAEEALGFELGAQIVIASEGGGELATTVGEVEDTLWGQLLESGLVTVAAAVLRLKSGDAAAAVRALLFLGAVARGPGGGNALEAAGLRVETVLDDVILQHSGDGGAPGPVAQAGWALLAAWPGQAKAIELDNAVAIRMLPGTTPGESQADSAAVVAALLIFWPERLPGGRVATTAYSALAVQLEDGSPAEQQRLAGRVLEMMLSLGNAAERLGCLTAAAEAGLLTAVGAITAAIPPASAAAEVSDSTGWARHYATRCTAAAQELSCHAAAVVVEWAPSPDQFPKRLEEPWPLWRGAWLSAACGLVVDPAGLGQPVIDDALMKRWILSAEAGPPPLLDLLF